MAQQVVNIGRLRRSTEGAQRGANQIRELLESIGRVEQTRRERQQLDRVARAVASGATTIEAISAAADQPTEFSGGLSGLLQKVGGRFQPPSTGGVRQSIQQAIIGRALRPKPLLTREEQREKAIFGTKRRPGETTQPFEQTKPEKARNRDIKILTETDKAGAIKATEVQKSSARRRLRKNPSIGEVPPGQTDYTPLLDKKLREKFDTKGFRLKPKDTRFGKKAYDDALVKAKDAALAQGATEASAEADFNAWWDQQVEAEAGQTFQKFQARSEFGRERLVNIQKKLETEAESRTLISTSETRSPGEAIAEFLKRTGK